MTIADAQYRAWWHRGVVFAVEIWHVLRRPSSVFSLGVLVMAGFIAGIMFWGAFNTALELTNTEAFCTSCHEMRTNVFAGDPQDIRQFGCCAVGNQKKHQQCGKESRHEMLTSGWCKVSGRLS